MSFRRQRPPDSLELLLDTMCNTFGGIILIAVLVTLLSRSSAKTSAAHDSEEMLRRRIAEAELTVQQSAAVNAELTATSADTNIHQRAAALAEKKRLQAETDSFSCGLANFQTNSPVASDAAARLKQLREQLQTVLSQRASRSNELVTARTNSSRLLQRSTALNKQAAALQQSTIQTLRLPKERQTDKRAFNILVQFGRVYPVILPDGERFPGSRYTELGKGYRVAPIVGSGIDPRSPEWRRLLAEVRSGRYIAFYVFGDSFAAFNVAKQSTVAAGFDYGWEPVAADHGPLAFGPVGTSPSAQ